MSSLRVRLLLLVAAVLVPSFVLLLALVNRERQVRLEVAQATAMQYVDAGLQTQQEAVEDGLRLLRAFTMLAQIRDGDAETCQRVLQTLSTMVDEAWSVVRTQANGMQDCSTRNEASLPRDASNHPAFAQLREQLTPFVGAYMLRADSAELLLPINVPLLGENGEFFGALSTGLRLQWFDRLTASLSTTPEAVVSISRAGGVLLRRHPENPAPGTVYPQNAVAQAMVERDRGVIEADGIDGVNRVWAFSRLPSPDSQPTWLSVGLPADAVYQGVNAELRNTLAVLAAWLVIIAAIAWWATDRFVLRDVRALLQATERLGSGDLSVRTDHRAHSDELRSLSSSFDDMAARLEERQAREAQAQKLESIGQLAGGVAHDFNNLLTAIIGNAELARDSLPAEAPARRELDAALDAADRSAALTRQLLAFARHTELIPRVVRVDTLLHGVSALLRRLIGEHITLSVETDHDLRLAELDVTSVEQAIVNLVVNARDAMPSGGQVVITARNARVTHGDVDHAHGVPSGDWIVLTVRDTGSGMSSDVLDRAFEPFFTTKAVGKGTGLGLAMVYGTVAQHSGHLWVESAPGHGTAVRLFLPPAAIDAEATAAPSLPVYAPPARNRIVLLVEDERAVRIVVARLLAENGFEVIVAEDGADALTQCDDAFLERIDLVVSDVVMPRVGGPELITMLRARRPDLPVLFVSGYRENQDLDLVLNTPNTGFLGKPFTRDVLLAAVHEQLGDVSAGAA